MNDREQHFVQLILARKQDEARRAAGEELASYDAERERNRGSGVDSSRWWLQVAKIASKHGKAFIGEAASAVAEISTSAAAYGALAEAATSFLDFLGGEYESRYRRNRFFYSPKDYQTAPLPPHWRTAREGLDLDLQINQHRFSDTSHPAQFECQGSNDDGLTAPLIVNAKPSDVRDKPYADEVAAILRARPGTKRSEALRQVVGQNELGKVRVCSDESAERAIRRCFDLHYTPQGVPHLKI